jgi:SWI/SNF-related matrix-associated actin-dependent regulator 1 of chromatin subfamily A
MAYKLFPHQTRGASFLSNSYGTKGLFFGMGTGKTVTALEGVAQVLAKAADTRVLIIAPPIALPMWLNEAQQYLGVYDNVSAILTTGKTPIKAGHRVLVISYAIAAARAAELRAFACVLICDESHALKNSEAKRTKAILGDDGIASAAAYSWMLTGTPITRWNDDMFPFLSCADPAAMEEYLGGTSLQKFQLKYTVRQKRKFAGARFAKDVVVGNRNTEDLAEWIYTDDNGRDAPLALRVDLEEVFANMPPLTKTRYPIKIDASPELKAQLKAMEKLSLQDIQEQLKSKEPALASVRRNLGLAKVKAAVAEIIERIESGQNVLVGAWHTDVIDALVAAISDKWVVDELTGELEVKYSVDVIDGRTSSKGKVRVTESWNAGKLNVVVAQIAAAGVSLNLQHGGTQIIVVEEDWSPSVMDQFYARLWRYGQKKHVHVDTLASDTKLDKALARISRTKELQHEKFNKVGRDQDE